MKKTIYLLLLSLPLCIGVHAQEVQDNDVRVQSNLENLDGDFTTFYWMEQQDAQNQQSMDGAQDRQSAEDRQGTMEGRTDEQHRGEAYGSNQDLQKSEKPYGNQSKDVKNAIEEAILHEMVSRGYEIDAENPDLLVGYQVLSEDTELGGFTDEDNAVTTAPAAQREMVEASAGSLLITFSETESGNMIWKGLLTEAFTETGTQTGQSETQTGQTDETGQATDEQFGQTGQDQQMGQTEQATRGEQDMQTGEGFAGISQEKVDAIKAVSTIFDRFAVDESDILGVGIQDEGRY